jgi:glutathione synthase/RimK-type ligase-like ATP-grasp enzyme
MKIRIEPYKLWSGGAKALGVRAGILRATNRQVNKHGDFDVVINWGRSERRFKGEYINAPEAVAVASDKLRTAEHFEQHGVPQPPYTTSREEAQGWLDDGQAVVCRTLLRASEGRGIVLANTDSGTPLAKAPLYARYVKKADEYRIHVAFGKVIDVQQKKRRLEVPDDKIDWQIRNAHNGWVFTRGGVSPPSCVLDAAVDAVAALGLDFGAVDIGYNIKGGAGTVYEVNTAPGLEGSTLDSYYKAFVEKFPQLESGAYRRRRSI